MLLLKQLVPRPKCESQAVLVSHQVKSSYRWRCLKSIQGKCVFRLSLKKKWSVSIGETLVVSFIPWSRNMECTRARASSALGLSQKTHTQRDTEFKNV